MGSFSYKIKKQDDTQKGILFGFFIEAEDSILPIYSSDIRLRAYKAEKNIDENYKNNNGRSDGRDWGWDNTEKDENRASDSSKPFPIAMIIDIVVIFIGIIFLIICCVLNSQKNRNRRRNNSSNQVYNENNNITQKKIIMIIMIIIIIIQSMIITTITIIIKMLNILVEMLVMIIHHVQRLMKIN